jgi:hypothetical protein
LKININKAYDKVMTIGVCKEYDEENGVSW